MRQTVKGFAAGYNAYLRRTGRAELPDPTCRGKGWVRAITPLDLYRRFYQLDLRTSSVNFLEEIVAAKPPVGTTAAATRRPAPRAFDNRLGPADMGSNAYGVGRDGARGDRALVLGNPHFPWHGSERFYEVHLTIPGKLNVIGAALQGVPIVNIGFNQDVAWSHTVSTARRFTPYDLQLVPGKPRQYMLDGKATKMRARTVRVRVRGGGFRRHTFYETRWGPVFSFTDAGLTWGTEHAYAIADVNANNFRLVNQWAEYDRATSVRGQERAYRRVQGNPWVNTIAADSEGRAYYADESVVPKPSRGLRTGIAVAAALAAPLPDASRLHAIAAACAPRGSSRWLAEHEVKALLHARGVPVVGGRLAASEDEAVAAFRALASPVALKVSAPTMRHKTAAGAIALDLRDEAGVREAFRRLSNGSPGETRGLTPLLVERMAAPGDEVFVAVRRDAVIPVLVVGRGGIDVEALDDVAIVPLPASTERIARALKALKLPVPDATAQIAAQIAEPADGLELLECNPVLIHRDGAVVVDATAKEVAT